MDEKIICECLNLSEEDILKSIKDNRITTLKDAMNHSVFSRVVDNNCGNSNG